MKQTKNTHTHTHLDMRTSLFICPPLHLSLISFTLISFLSLNETMSTAHNQAPGPALHCQKGARDPIFGSGSIISVP